MRVDFVNRDLLSIIDIASKVMKTTVEMFGSGSELGHFGDFQSSSIVLEYLASNFSLAGFDRNTDFHHLFENVHDRDRITQCVREAGVFTLSGA